MKQGNGECNFANGSTYRGEYRNDKIEGDGVFICPKGNRYEG